MVFIGRDMDDWSGDWVFRPWLAEGEPRKSGFFFRFSDRFWLFLKDPGKSEEEAYDLILPNQWSHLCMAFSTETKLFQVVLVSIKLEKKYNRTMHKYIWHGCQAAIVKCEIIPL